MFRTTYSTGTRWLDTLVSLFLVGVVGWFLHFRSHHDPYTTSDTLTVAVLLGTALAIGWRDRLPLVTRAAAKLLGHKDDPRQP